MLAALVIPAAAGVGDEAPTVLDPVEVTAPVTPLDRSLYLLRLLVEQSAPCLGCDAAAAGRVPALPVLDYLMLPADRVDEVTRLARDVKLQDSRDLEYLRR